MGYTAERRTEITERFGAENAERILGNQVWVGATEEMLRESIGAPADVDEKVLKTKTRHVFKYCSTGKNRYALRVFLEDGVVTGWEGKPEAPREEMLAEEWRKEAENQRRSVEAELARREQKRRLYKRIVYVIVGVGIAVYFRGACSGATNQEVEPTTVPVSSPSPITTAPTPVPSPSTKTTAQKASPSKRPSTASSSIIREPPFGSAPSAAPEVPPPSPTPATPTDDPYQ